jgi:hypothetical protein
MFHVGKSLSQAGKAGQSYLGLRQGPFASLVVLPQYRGLLHPDPVHTVAGTSRPAPGTLFASARAVGAAVLSGYALTTPAPSSIPDASFHSTPGKLPFMAPCGLASEE